jgi:hypothetical protein
MVLLHFKPCHHGLTRVFMYLSFLVIQENAIFDCVEDGFNLDVLPQWAMSSSKLKFEKVLFHSEYLIDLMDQKDRVMEHNTRRVMKHNLILQCAMSLMHRRKSCLRNREVSFFQRSRDLRFSAINASFTLVTLCYVDVDEYVFMS